MAATGATDWIQTSPGCDINRQGEGTGGGGGGGGDRLSKSLVNLDFL